MVGIKTKWKYIQLSVTVYPEHARIIEKILKKEHSKPIAHKSASEVIRKALEYYAEYLGIKLDYNKI